MREASEAERESIVARVLAAFGRNEYPGDRWLQGSFDGCEGFEETSAFFGRTDWTSLEPEFLDAHYAALSFFSEAGLRFFLPAYLIADVRGRLVTADPLFHLTHGFDAVSEDARGDGRRAADVGAPDLINPRRYGAASTFDYARYRLSVFTREEAGAIVAYLEFRRSLDDLGLDSVAVDAALRVFWHERVRTAPTGEALERYLARQAESAAALEARARDHDGH